MSVSRFYQQFWEGIQLGVAELRTSVEQRLSGRTIFNSSLPVDPWCFERMSVWLLLNKLSQFKTLNVVWLLSNDIQVEVIIIQYYEMWACLVFFVVTLFLWISTVLKQISQALLKPWIQVFSLRKLPVNLLICNSKSNFSRVSLKCNNLFTTNPDASVLLVNIQ